MGLENHELETKEKANDFFAIQGGEREKWEINPQGKQEDTDK